MKSDNLDRKFEDPRITDAYSTIHTAFSYVPMCWA